MVLILSVARIDVNCAALLVCHLLDSRLWQHGTDYLEPQQIQVALTSRQLKVETKTNNIAGLQLADLIAHPSRTEILWENGLRETPPAPLAQRIILILQEKYDRSGERTFGKKML